MAKLDELLGKYLVEWPDGATYARQDGDREICFEGCGMKHDFYAAELAEDARVVGGIGENMVTCDQYLAARDRIAMNAQATKEAREIAQGDGPRFCSSEHMIAAIESEEMPKPDRKLWKRAALAAFTGYCARPGMDAECAAEEAMYAADAFMNAMEKHLSSN